MGHVMNAMGGSGGNTSPTTIRQFLNTLPDYTYVEGESLVTDLLMTLAGELTFQDMVSIVTRNPSPTTLGNLQEPLKRFIVEKILLGAEPTEANIKTALLRIGDEWFNQLVESSRQANVRDGIDYPETVHNFLSNRPVELIMMTLQAERNDFATRLPTLVSRISAELLLFPFIASQTGWKVSRELFK